MIHAHNVFTNVVSTPPQMVLLMFSFVLTEVTAVSKPLATVLTAVRFLTSVGPHMSDKGTLLTKSTLAMVTSKRFFPSVGPKMYDKRRLLIIS